MKMHKLNKHIFQCKKFFINSKNRTFSLKVVSHGVPLGQLDHVEFNSPYHSRTFLTIFINLIIYLHLLNCNFKYDTSYLAILYKTKVKWQLTCSLWNVTLNITFNTILSTFNIKISNCAFNLKACFEIHQSSKLY